MSLGPLMIDLQGTSVTAQDAELLRNPLVGGVILFTRNYADPEQLTQLVAAIQRHEKRVFGVDIPAVGVPLYSDARLYGEHGVPIVMYGAGPRTLEESNAKGRDENLLLDDLRRATQVVACSVHDLLTS